MYRVKSALRRLVYGPPPEMHFWDWLNEEKVAENARYPWFMEEWRAVALDYMRVYAEQFNQRAGNKRCD